MRVAIVHDWLTTYGGGERVVEQFRALFPDAPIYTLVYDKKKLGSLFPRENVKTTYVQKIPGGVKFYKKLLFLMPSAFEALDLSSFDLVLSSSSCCAKGVITNSDTPHISYIHTPIRYAWDLYHQYYESAGRLTRFMMRRTIPKIRLWDLLSSFRVDSYIANSTLVKRRIEKCYRRDSVVIHPPVRTDFFTPSGDKREYYMILSRFIPYKRIDLAIEACNRLQRPLIVVGGGPLERSLKKMAGPTIKFTGAVSDEETRELYRGCRAFLFPGLEDFGITPVEAQACGRPVIAYGKGGILDSVIEGETGLFFSEQTVESLVKGIERFEEEESHFKPQKIRAHIEKFSESRFREKILELIASHTDSPSTT